MKDKIVTTTIKNEINIMCIIRVYIGNEIYIY